MNITEKRTETIINYLVENHYLEYCYKYGELGYQDPEAGILFCNWNDVPQITQDYLEEAGYSLEWSDEWVIDYDNSKAYRTSPDSYGWESRVRFVDGELLTPDDDIDCWIEYAKVTDYAQEIGALPSFIDLSNSEYELIEETYENGWHEGQNDDPMELARHFLGLDGVESIIFQMDETSQFYIKFKVWVERV